MVQSKKKRKRRELKSNSYNNNKMRTRQACSLTYLLICASEALRNSALCR